MKPNVYFINEISKESLYQQYIVNNLSIKECQEYFNIGQSMLMRVLKEYNIKKPKDAHVKNIKKSKLERYGSENYNNRDRAKQTCIETYGVENVFQLDNVKSKSEQTKLERYNNAHYVNTNKNIQTKIALYGSVKEAYKQRNIKSIETCIERYGVENVALVEEVKNKIISTQKLNWANKSEKEKQDIAKKISSANKGRIVWNKGKKIG